jgi:hypothetical protein
VYKKGVDNKVADALSRRPSASVDSSDARLLAVSTCKPK